MPQPPTIDPCPDERERANETLEDFRDAIDDRRAAKEDLDDAESFWDESTWANVGAAGGIALACATTPIGWTACGIGLVLGGTTFVANEVDRAGDIEDAEDALARAERDYWKANSRWQRAERELAHCLRHNQLIGRPRDEPRCRAPLGRRAEAPAMAGHHPAVNLR